MIHQQLSDFFKQWHNHKFALPRIENKTPDTIRASLGYLPLKLPFDVPHREMLIEAAALKDYYVYHRSGGHHQGWRSLCLHGISSVHTENHDRYGFIDRESAGYCWTDISRFCPVTTQFFRDIFGYESYDRVRFMLLEPGGYILPHADVDYQRLSPINMALNNPIGCDFVMQDWGTIPFNAGTANMLAVGNTHAVFNGSDEDRYHIIVHGIRSDVWKNYLLDSFADMEKTHA
jgi:Aspartyl/Asparaginyl beta-hydroxylase